MFTFEYAPSNSAQDSEPSRHRATPGAAQGGGWKVSGSGDGQYSAVANSHTLELSGLSANPSYVIIGCLTLGKLLNSSVPQFPPL